MEQIIVDVGPDGSLRYEVKGVKGVGCKDVAKFLAAIGEVVETKPTAEMHAAASAQIRQGGGK